MLSLLFSLILVVNGHLLMGYFQVDDFNWLRLAHAQSVFASFHGPWGHGIAYRPISRVSFYLDAKIFGWRAGAWHAENLFIHAIACTCLYALGRLFHWKQSTCSIAAALFALSPLGSENIDWISGRTGLLCIVFVLSAALSWLAGFQDRRWWALTALLYLLGMMTYEPAVILPGLLLCLSPVLAARGPKTWMFRSLAALCFIGAVFWCVRFYLLGTFVTDVDPLYGDVWTAIRFNSGSLIRCFHAAWGNTGLIFLGVTSILCLRSRKVRPGTIALLLMSVIFYLPYLMVIGVAPRFLFMAQAPLCMLIAIASELSTGRRKKVFVALTLAFLLLLARTSYRRAASMAKAGDTGREILDQMVRLDIGHESNMVLDGVPDAASGSPVMLSYFEVAARARLRSSATVLARSSVVLENAGLLRAALTQPTRFFQYDAATGVFREVRRSAWVSLHSAQIASAGENPPLTGVAR